MTYHPDPKAELEQLFDVDIVLHMLAEICMEKAEHVQSSWQDPQLAKEWEGNSRNIELLSDKLTKQKHARR